ncbi:MAG: nucleotidyltransferase domain-containing protein [Pseudomonadota bacterium]
MFAPGRGTIVQKPGQVWIALADGCQVDGYAMGRLEPVSFEPGQALINQSDKPVLVLCLGLTDQAGLWVYGSRAHGRAGPGSDLDLICVSDHSTDEDHAYGPVSVFFANSDRLLSRAADGDLFVKSLIGTAQPIADPQDFLTSLMGAFVNAADYDSVIRHALDFSVLLISWPVQQALPEAAVTKLTWCLRAVLMAQGFDPFADAQGLTQDDTQALAVLQTAKRTRQYDWGLILPASQAFFDRVLFDANTPSDCSFSDMVEFFEYTRNEPALRFLAKHHLALTRVVSQSGVPDMNTPLAWLFKA